MPESTTAPAAAPELVSPLESIHDERGLTYSELLAMEDRFAVSGVLPSFGGQYPPRVGVRSRSRYHVDGFVDDSGQVRHMLDLHQAILSMSIGWHDPEVEELVDRYEVGYPGVDMVDTTQLYAPAVALKKDLVEACEPYGKYRALLASSGTNANEQAIRLCMGALGGPEKIQLIVLEGGYGGADLTMNSHCEVPGWTGDTSMPQTALVLKRDGSNLDEMMAKIPADKTPILHMEDGVQGVGGFFAMEIPVMRAFAKAVHERKGLLILDNVQAFVRNGEGLMGVDRWAERDEDGEIAEYCRPAAFTLAKGLGNGRGVAATLVAESVLEGVKSSTKKGASFDTFSQPREGIAAARMTLHKVRSGRLWEHARKSGESFRGGLTAGLQERGIEPSEAEVFGVGALTGIRLASEEQVKRALAMGPAHELLFAKGGMRNEVIRAPMPFNAPQHIVDTAYGRMAELLHSVLRPAQNAPIQP